MEQERSQVLAMLSEGKLTPKQADQLLEALEASGAAEAHRTVELPSHIERHPAPAPYPGQRNKPGFTAEQLVQLRIHGVSPDYIREMRALGLEVSLDGLIRLATHGIKPSYIKEMRTLGFTDLTIDDLVELGTHGIDPAFIRELSEQGLTDLTTDEIIELGIHGVDAAYVRQLRDADTEA